MPNDFRPRRSALYVPGSNARAIQKSSTLDADVIILDLEDSVAPDDKAAAREQVLRLCKSCDFGQREVVIRINRIDTPYYAGDLQCAISAAPAAVLLAKVEDPSHVLAAAQALELAGTSAHVELWGMIETPRGVLASERIASAHDRLTCLVMGTSDLTCDLRARHVASRQPLLYSLGQCLLVARAYGKSILDGVHLDLADDEGFIVACQQGRQLGFDGKTLIHPRQIAPCNAAFSPNAAELERAEAVIRLYSAAREAGRGVAVLEGQLIEEMHAREASRVLALGAATGNARVERQPT